ncbi:serine hydrolase domain-containing protein [Arthrobacter wenxiniae]|jgi:CubicO group peptidase (beta-lactamase class C family)|uniref:Beta-lactamase family protein n=1 Tax=Arthrobacter wenxiniae TaxID=2713570 RepID=A0A7Y7IK11_9MICC|nr:serine hydrolase domain-containing protein [Arthrobacter wenxiniae]NVM96887.1 beta-lactamase family protein [Arthrobacter wenxiniae]
MTNVQARAARESHLDYSHIDEQFGQVAHEIAASSDGSPALAWAVISQDEILHFSSMGETKLGRGHRPAANTVFRIASLSKSFAAATTLLLEREGLLDLDAPVVSYLPGLADEGPAGRLPTLHDVLSMSAGFPSDDAWADRQESMTTEAFDALLVAGTVRTTRPGQAFQYSNFGYAMIGRIIETVTGEPYPEVVRALLFGPLGLDSTTFDYRNVPRDSLANGYLLSGRKWHLQELTAPGSFSAIGGVLSNISDMSKWVGTLAAATSSSSDDGHLPSELRRRMQQPVTPLPYAIDTATGLPRSRDFPWGPSGYGLGLFIEQDPDFGPISHHVGGYPGYGAHMCWHQASGMGVIAFGGSTYAPVSAPAIHALKSLLNQPAAMTIEIDNIGSILAAVRSFILHGNVTDTAYASCVALDRSWQERRGDLACMKEQVGPLIPDESQVAVINNSHLKVNFHGPGGILTAEVRLTPSRPRQVQVLNLDSQPATPHSHAPPNRGQSKPTKHSPDHKS